MAAIRESIEIARRPEEVFAYIDDLGRHGEWQEQIVSARVETDGPTRVGTRVTDIRKVGGRQQSVPYEITEHNPPRGYAFRGVDGPIRPLGRVTVEGVGDGSRTRTTLELDFEGRGFGKVLRPMVIRQARKQVPKDQQRLRERLESGAV